MPTKFFYYVQEALRAAVPAPVYRARREGLLHAAHALGPSVQERVDYYCKLTDPFDLGAAGTTIADFDPSPATVYHIDLYRYLRYFDRENRFETLAVVPGQEMLKMGTRVSTNHQPGSSWPIYEEKVHTHYRYQYLDEVTGAAQLSSHEFSRRFLQPPLYNTQFGRGFGTLYSAAFYPQSRTCEYLWPEQVWSFDLDKFDERKYRINFVDPEGYPAKSQSYGEIYTARPLPVLNY